MQLDADVIADAVVDTVAIALAPAVRDLAQMKGFLDGLSSRLAVVEGIAALAPRDGRDGKDAPPVDLEAIAAKAAALIPAPRDGRDGDRGQDGQAGKDGTNGKDAPPVDLELVAIKAAALVQVPVPKDGRDGQDADPAVIANLRAEVLSLKALLSQPPVDIEAKVMAAVEMAVKALPAPKDGTNGRDGKDGRDVDATMLQTIVAASVERVLAEWPKPKDGTSLTPEDVAPLIKAEVAAATAEIRSGTDGVGFVGALIDQDGCLQLTKSDGSTQQCGRVVGLPGRDADMELLKKQITDEIAQIPRPKDGERGQDGKDGLGIEDADLILDDVKGYVFRMSNAQKVKECPVYLPVPRGVYRPGVTYHKSALVMAQGSYWIAEKETSERPGDGATSWRLVTKKGRDGKDLTDRRPE